MSGKFSGVNVVVYTGPVYIYFTDVSDHINGLFCLLIKQLFTMPEQAWLNLQQYFRRPNDS